MPKTASAVPASGAATQMSASPLPITKTKIASPLNSSSAPSKPLKTSSYAGNSLASESSQTSTQTTSNPLNPTPVDHRKSPSINSPLSSPTATPSLTKNSSLALKKYSISLKPPST